MFPANHDAPVIDRFLPMDRRLERSGGPAVPEWAEGAVLFADISGFSALSAQLAEALGVDAGAEALSGHLDRVFSAMNAEIHAAHGSVIAFAGDAVLCWFADAPEGDGTARALGCAAALHASLRRTGTVEIGRDRPAILALKVGLGAGRVRRMLVGDPTHLRLEVLAGDVVDGLEEAGHLAEPGDIVVTDAVLARVPGLTVSETRRAPDGTSAHVLVDAPAGPRPGWPEATAVPDDEAAGWVLGPVLDRIRSGQREYLAALRVSVPVFLRFDGPDYSADPDAGRKLDAYVVWVQQVLARFEGELLQLTTGDKGSNLFLVFGALKGHEDDTARALAAADALHRPPSDLGFVPRERIGISTGRLFAGTYGGEHRVTFAVLGHETNLAARLMGKAEPGETLVTDGVRLGQERTEFVDRGRVALAGQPRPVQLWGALGSAQRSGLASAGSHATVGRAEHLAAIHDHLARLLDGVRSTVIVEGQPGIGKTRLVTEARARAPAALRVLRGGADSIDRATPFLIWRPVLAEILGDVATPAAIGAAVARLAPDRAGLAPLVGAALGVAMPDTELTAQLTGRLRIDNAVDIAARLVAAAAASHPLLLVLEDLHWMDAASWALLARVARDVPRLGILAATRPIDGRAALDAAAEIRALPHAHSRSLGALEREQVAALLCERLGVDALPQALLDQVMFKARGHPYFSQVVVEALRQRGILEVRAGAAVLAAGAARLDRLDLPDTIEGVLSGRIDELAATEQLVLKVASVIGYTFAVRLLRDVHPIEGDRPEISAHLGKLADQQFVRPALPEPDAAFQFEHEILREVSYGLLLFLQRQRLHRAIAEWLEVQGEGEARLPRLAHHWSRAAGADPAFDPGAAEKAIHYLGLAGDESLGAFACEQATVFYQEALALGERMGPADALGRARLHLQLSKAYQGLGDLGRCLDHGSRALAAIGRPIPTRNLSVMAFVMWEMVRRRLPRFLTRTAEETPVERRRTELEVDQHITLARTFYHTNATMSLLYSDALKLRIAERRGPSAELAEATAGVAFILALMQMYRRADDLFASSIAMAEAAGRQAIVVTIRVAHSAYLMGAGRFAELQASMALSRGLCEELGDRDQWGDCVGMQADAHLLAGQLPEAVARYEELQERAIRTNNHLHLLWALRGFAVMALRDGRSADAAKLLEHALLLLERTVDQHTRIDIVGLLAVAELRLGRAAVAYDHAVRAAGLISEVRSPSAYGQYLGYAAVAETFLLLDEGADLARRRKQAIRDLGKYSGAFRIGKPQTDRYAGLWLVQRGKHRTARTRWTRALACARELGLAYEISCLEALLAG